MASKRSASAPAPERNLTARDPFQVHTTLEFRGGNTPGLIVRHGGGSELRYLEFALPEKPRSVRVEWNNDEYSSAREGNKDVPVRLIVDNGTPRALTYKNGAFYQKGRSARFVDKKVAVIGERLAAVFVGGGANDRTPRAARPTGTVNPYGWFSCMADVAGTGAGLGAAAGGVAGAPGGVAGAAAGAGVGAGIGAAAGAIFGIGWCTTNSLIGVA